MNASGKCQWLSKRGFKKPQSRELFFRIPNKNDNKSNLVPINQVAAPSYVNAVSNVLSLKRATTTATEMRKTTAKNSTLARVWTTKKLTGFCSHSIKRRLSTQPSNNNCVRQQPPPPSNIPDIISCVSKQTSSVKN